MCTLLKIGLIVYVALLLIAATVAIVVNIPSRKNVSFKKFNPSREDWMFSVTNNAMFELMKGTSPTVDSSVNHEDLMNDINAATIYFYNKKKEAEKKEADEWSADDYFDSLFEEE